jgi:hypothetical protein
MRESRPLPTVADFRRLGVKGVRVSCNGCGRMSVAEFGAIQARDDETIIDLRRRAYVCTGCGSRENTIMPDWPRGTSGGMPLT